MDITFDLMLKMNGMEVYIYAGFEVFIMVKIEDSS